MKCVTPMFRVYELGNHKKGVVVPRSEVLDSLNFDENHIRRCMETWSAKNRYTKKRLELIPCGHCFACALNYSAEWATRIMLEAKKYENNFWITLTYNNEHLPIAERINYGEKIFENDGDIKWCEGCLVEEHMVTFLDSLRHYFRSKGHTGIKYYYCGEYGSETHRPHYHIVLLNCPLDVTQFYDTHIDEQWKAHWKSKEIEKYWAEGEGENRKPRGMVDVCELEWSNAAYTARYCAKKLFKTTTTEEYCQEGKIPEFIRMSKGIGMDYFTENMQKMYKEGNIIAKTVKGNVCPVKIPRAFDKKFKELYPEQYELVRLSRKHSAERMQKQLNLLNNYTDKQKMIMDAEKLLTKSTLLPREGI